MTEKQHAMSLEAFQKCGFSDIGKLNKHFATISLQVRQAIKDKQWDIAESLVTEVLSIHPEQLHALKDLASIKSKQGDVGTAYRVIQGALAIYPNSEVILDAVTSTCCTMNRNEEALYFARKSINVKKNNTLSNSCDLSHLNYKKKKLSKDPARNIISYSLFGDSPRYCETAIINVTLAAAIYPEWTCRFYIDSSVPESIINRLKNAGAQVVAMQRDDGIYSGLFWRFYVINDNDVDCFLIRDADSLLSYRERAAVDEWLASDKCFHLMRDAIAHSELILAGMWGGYTGILPDIQMMIDQHPDTDASINRTIDQIFLRRCVFPLIQASCMCHDHYHLDHDTHRFPSHAISDIEKIPYFHVGMIDAGALQTSVYADYPDGSLIRWHIVDCSSGNIICSYEQIIAVSGKINLILPYWYSKNIDAGIWEIRTELVTTD